jgi:hypothetical protein
MACNRAEQCRTSGVAASPYPHEPTMGSHRAWLDGTAYQAISSRPHLGTVKPRLQIISGEYPLQR